MTNLQIIEALCSLTERQAKLIYQLANELEQFRTLDEAEKEAVSSIDKEYMKIVGADELPDI